MAETLVQIRIEVAKLGEKIDQFKDMPDRLRETERKVDEALQRESVSENRIKDIEQGNAWLWRTVAGTAIATLASLVVALIKFIGTTGG
jgi:hypothetical protein